MKKLLFILVMSLAMGSAAKAQEIPSRPLEAFSLFSTNFQMKDYAFALPYGKHLIKNYPKELPEHPAYRGHIVFLRMIRIYSAMSEEAMDPAIKAAYLDSASTLFTQVFNIFTPEEIDMYDWTLERGKFYQNNSDYIESGMDNALVQYKKLLELDENRTIELGDGYYISLIVQNLVSNGDRDAAVTMIEKSKGKVDSTTAEYFDRILNSLFSNPVERITFLEGKLADDKENLQLIGELFDLYVRVDNREKINEFGKVLYEKAPDMRNTMRMADMARKNGDYRGANGYLEVAIKMAETNDEKSTIWLLIADNRMNINDLRGSRDAAKQSIQFNPNNGNAYFKVAEAYANAVSACAGGRMEREDKVVYWLVLDYLDRAKRADPALANSVNRQASTYAQVAPSAEDKFFKGWNNGDNIRVDSSLRDCYSWINESTTVR
jgi:tetratricopeptide (TPR) repeat protein